MISECQQLGISTRTRLFFAGGGEETSSGSWKSKWLLPTKSCRLKIYPKIIHAEQAFWLFLERWGRRSLLEMTRVGKQEGGLRATMLHLQINLPAEEPLTDSLISVSVSISSIIYLSIIYLSSIHLSSIIYYLFIYHLLSIYHLSSIYLSDLLLDLNPLSEALGIFIFPIGYTARSWICTW